MYGRIAGSSIKADWWREPSISGSASQCPKSTFVQGGAPELAGCVCSCLVLVRLIGRVSGLLWRRAQRGGLGSRESFAVAVPLMVHSPEVICPGPPASLDATIAPNAMSFMHPSTLRPASWQDSSCERACRRFGVIPPSKFALDQPGDQRGARRSAARTSASKTENMWRIGEHKHLPGHTRAFGYQSPPALAGVLARWRGPGVRRTAAACLVQPQDLHLIIGVLSAPKLRPDAAAPARPPSLRPGGRIGFCPTVWVMTARNHPRPGLGAAPSSAAAGPDTEEPIWRAS